MILRNRRNGLGGKVKHSSTGVDEVLPLGIIKCTEAGGGLTGKTGLENCSGPQAEHESTMPPWERKSNVTWAA